MHKRDRRAFNVLIATIAIIALMSILYHTTGIGL